MEWQSFAKKEEHMEEHIEDEKIPKMRNSQKGKRHSAKEKKHTKERGGSHWQGIHK